jgi:hypothetical protein
MNPYRPRMRSIVLVHVGPGRDNGTAWHSSTVSMVVETVQ